MASRKEQKEAARARRLAEEQARQERARRDRRLRMLGGTLIVAVAVVAIAIAVSSGGGGGAPKLNTPAARAAATSVNSLLAGIPQSGTTLGNPSAPVTITEYGDLKCPICKDFALGAENQLITNDVKTGKAKLVYKSLCTATCGGPQPGIFGTQQADAYAAGAQNKAWYYIELFYHLQGDETASYVTPAFLEGLAKLVPGLNFSQWRSASSQATYKSQVTADENAAATKGYTSTPTVIIAGPKGTQVFDQSLEDYPTYQSAVTSVS
jgi:protein-disulfide isomerase